MNGFDFDLFVIGGGSGGVRAARMAAQRGARVGLAEAGGPAMLGGTCVNLGCIPKKLYSYAAHAGEAMQEARGFGWEGEPWKFNWQTLKANRRQEIARLNGVYANLLQGVGVQVLFAHAQLLGSNRLLVGDREVTAAHILVATGGHPSLQKHEIDSGAISSNELFDLESFPRHLVVVGGGYIACEFASIFHGLGAQVTQLYRGEQILRGFDDGLRHFLAGEMRKAGIDLRLNTQVKSLSKQGARRELVLGSGEVLTADAVLYATGRVPNVAGLGLEAAGVAQGKDGAILVDGHFQTNVPSIHAVGDVTARVQLTPVALGEAMVVVDRLFGPPQGKAMRAMSYDLIPTAVFTHPNVGTVGWTEAQARERLRSVQIFQSEFKPLKHTLSGSSERCFMKLVVDADTDRVVGLHMVGAEAGEIVQGFAVAMKAGATKAVFDATIGIHPTAAEEFVTMREPLR